jgi:uncharacterized cupin superfamily protein
MSDSSIRKFDAAVAVQEYRLPAEKRLHGNPLQRIWNHYTDASGKFSAGVWSSEQGKWKIAYTEEEYCRILKGLSVITDSSGHALRVAAGDEFVVPRGFVGTWEVIEPTEKTYVIYEADT